MSDRDQRSFPTLLRLAHAGAGDQRRHSVRIALHLRLAMAALVVVWSASTGCLVGLPPAMPMGLVCIHAVTAGVGVLVTLALFAERLTIRDGVLRRRRLLTVSSVPVRELELLRVDPQALSATLVGVHGHTLLRLDLTAWPRRRVEALFSAAGVSVLHAAAGGEQGC